MADTVGEEIAMRKTAQIQARVSMLMHATPAHIAHAFTDPGQLASFWLASSSGPLTLNSSVHWRFMVAGAEVDTIATRIDADCGLAWDWSDGTHVDISLEKLDGGAVAVTLIHDGFRGSAEDIIAAALDACEGYALVLADLKTLLEQGVSARIVRDKARLIARRKNIAFVAGD
ncbi:hypothetical protein [Janthinobacterium psychrotolerans]|uniref:Uncharacterized protein n=1 Tax=Janthinobacterium psychrotolerans TaxID=1747903 RepID=A0A1A7BWG2_9BURK|nr:hypothetical protein [Janthinobacterium psychrotolerans]OBV37921.1 hypothetical protein ASR47_1004196 [Janthinobacterium psychrotolerans]